MKIKSVDMYLQPWVKVQKEKSGCCCSGTDTRTLLGPFFRLALSPPRHLPIIKIKSCCDKHRPLPHSQRKCKLWIEGSPAPPWFTQTSLWPTLVIFPELIIWSMKFKSGWFGIEEWVLGKIKHSDVTCASEEREPGRQGLAVMAKRCFTSSCYTSVHVSLCQEPICRYEDFISLKHHSFISLMPFPPSPLLASLCLHLWCVWGVS